MASHNNERGIALVLALFLMTALSVLGASLMFLSQTETYASMNYRTMSQTRYAAEAGVNKVANFLLDSAQYAGVSAAGADPIGAYDITRSPVQFGGQAVVLSAMTGVASNYPIATVQTAFNAAGQGTLTAGNATLTYKTFATLVSMSQFTDRFGDVKVIQTWEITADGGLTGSSKATVRVAGTIETPKVPANSMAAFATDNGCDALQLFGSMSTDSYDSSLGTYAATQENSGGDVGTNGNIHVWGHADVNGQLYTPRPGVGACTAGAVTGLTDGGSISVADSLVSLPKAMTFPVPPLSATPGTNTVTIDGGMGSTVLSATTFCASLGLVIGVNCDCLTSSGGSAAGGAIGSYKTLVISGGGADVTLPNISVSQNYELKIAVSTAAQTVNINSLGGKGNVTFDYTSDTQRLILQVAGKNPDGSEMATPFDLSDIDSTWKQNKPSGAVYDASALEIVYSGTQAITMKGGNSQSAVTIYAPNSNFSLQGTQDLYGSILAKTVSDGGNAGIHYDRRLQREFWIVGQPMMGTFTWQRAQ